MDTHVHSRLRMKGSAGGCDVRRPHTAYRTDSQAPALKGAAAFITVLPADADRRDCQKGWDRPVTVAETALCASQSRSTRKAYTLPG